jgi:SAM-dependent methyltransferase
VLLVGERSIPADVSATSALSFTSVLSLLSGHAVVRAIAVVAEMGIPDLLATGPQTAGELAQRCEAHEESLFRIMRALAAVGVFAQTAPPIRFELNALSNWLRSDVPSSLRDFARVRGGELCWDAWRPLYRAAKSGECAFELAHHAEFFDYLRSHPADARLFNDGMRSLSSQVHAAVIRAYDFSQFSTLTDVGGGSGAFMAALLTAHPRLRGMLFDQASAIDLSGEVLRARNVAERCQCIAGDFFESVPSGSEAILLSRVLHDFDDVKVLCILRNCHSALPRGGKLLIVEYVVTDDEEGVAAKLFDLHMLAYFGAARERTREELQCLLEESGFSLQRVVRTTASIAVIEAIT